MCMTTDERLEALEARIKALEDELALRQILSSYGPAVDSLRHEDAVKLWTEDGRYLGRYDRNNRQEILEMLEGDFHKDLVAAGCAHTMSTPFIKIDGDTAVGLGYHVVFKHDGDGFIVRGLSASRWDWIRTADGWKATSRVHRTLDGSEDARRLLSETFAQISGLAE